MYTNWTDVPMNIRIEWAEWAIENGKDEMTEEERVAWANDRQMGKDPMRDPTSDAVYLPRSSKSEAARMRSRRYQILKRLEEHFQIYQLFTPAEAARLTGMNREIVAGYLEYECRLPSSRIMKGPEGTYKILTGFEIGASRGS